MLTLATRMLFSISLFSVFGALHAIPTDIDFSPLTAIIGLPFTASPETSVRIHQQNSSGDAVGNAYFLNQAKSSLEEALWYWDSKTKLFQIIASSLSVPRTKKGLFQFYDARINENGVVACTYLDGRVLPQVRPDQTNCDYLYNWFWWSMESGLHVSTPTSRYQILTSIDNLGYVFLDEHVLDDRPISLRSICHAACIFNIYDPKYCRELFYKVADIRPFILDWILANRKVSCFLIKGGSCISYAVAFINWHSLNMAANFLAKHESDCTIRVDVPATNFRQRAIYCFRLKANFTFPNGSEIPKLFFEGPRGSIVAGTLMGPVAMEGWIKRDKNGKFICGPLPIIER